jgi:hypothetical protein
MFLCHRTQVTPAHQYLLTDARSAGGVPLGLGAYELPVKSYATNLCLIASTEDPLLSRLVANSSALCNW